MKRKLIFLPLLLLMVFTMWQCKTDETDGLSKVVKVEYPVITLKGDEVIFLNVGDSYVEAGATLRDSSANITRDIEPTDNPVDAATPGGYLVTYTAANTNGFETTVYRLVIVRPAADAALDLTGHYVRNTGVAGAEFDMTKVGRGVYLCSNMGGVPGDPATQPAIIPVYVIQFEDGTIDVPLQPAPNGVIEGENEEATATTIKWSVQNNSLLGTAVRTFNKQ